MGQLLPNAREARAWQAHAAHIDQASGGDCGFTCRAPPNVRFGGDGCARTWLPRRALSLQTIIYRRRHAYAWTHRRRNESAVAGEVTRWRRTQRALMRERRAAARAGGEAPPKSSQRAVWSGHLNRIRRPERPEEGGCKVVTPKHMRKGGVGGCYNPPLGCNN